MANLVPLSNSSIIKGNKISTVKVNKLLRSSSKIVKVSKKTNEGPKLFENPLVKIEKQVIQIDKILKDMLSLQRKQTEKQRVGEEQKDFAKKEKELESKRPKVETKIKLPSPPKLGFFDWIKNFITNTILGFFAVRLIDFLPQLLKILPVVISAGDFLIDWGGKLLDGLITFVDWGYKAIDGTRQFIKNLGGESWAQNFDRFAGAVDNIIEIAVIAALATADSGGSGGPDIDIKKSAGKAARGPLSRLGRRAFVGALGKGGAKTVLKFVKPLVSKIPIIGGLIEFGLSWALGEPLGKAAFRGIGSILIGTIGTLIGGPVGAFLGSWAGGEAGGLLYDAIFKNKKPNTKVVKAAGGGKPVTRGGKPVSGKAKRTISKKKKPRTLKATPPKLRPGNSIGGEDKIKKLYPESKDKTKMSPFDFFKKSYETFSKSTGFNQLVALAIKPLMGDKPGFVDYKNAAAGINNWMNSALSPETLAYAGGGEVKMESVIAGEDYSSVIAKSLQDSVAPESDKIIRDLMQQLMLTPKEVEKEKPPGQEPEQVDPGEEFGGDATEMIGGARLLMDAGFPSLAASVLSSVIQAESAWKGQRTPWVLNDGAGTNKGLISWNRSRIVNAEKFLGKPLEKASNAEQVRWIKEELKQYGLLDDMMNPNATESDLKNAIYKYVRWDRRYDEDHWKYIPRIRTAIEKGERGSYVEPVGGVDQKGVPPLPPTGTLGGQNYGDLRKGGRRHAGQDYDISGNQKFYSRIGGEVVNIGYDPKPKGYGNYVDIYNKNLNVTERIAEGAKVLVQRGENVRKGQAIVQGESETGVIHYEIRKGRNTSYGFDGTIDPKKFLSTNQQTASKFHGGIGVVSKDGLTLKLHKGEIFKVVDKDSVDLFGRDFIQDIIDIENKSQLVARAPSIIEKLKSISGYTDYENPYSEPEIIFIPLPSQDVSGIPAGMPKPSFTLEGGIDNSMSEQISDTLMYG